MMSLEQSARTDAGDHPPISPASLKRSDAAGAKARSTSSPRILGTPDPCRDLTMEAGTHARPSFESNHHPSTPGTSRISNPKTHANSERGVPGITPESSQPLTPQTHQSEVRSISIASGPDSTVTASMSAPFYSRCRRVPTVIILGCMPYSGNSVNED